MIMVIDTDILIGLGNGVAEAMARVKTEALTNKLTICVITKLELLVGCQNKTEMRSLEQFLVQFEVIPLSAAIGNQAVNLLKQYRLSHGLLIPDALIAATALTLDCSLLSKNQRDFKIYSRFETVAVFYKTITSLTRGALERENNQKV